MKNELKNLLADFGFKPNEIKVYLALTTLGEALFRKSKSGTSQNYGHQYFGKLTEGRFELCTNTKAWHLIGSNLKII